MQASLPLGEIQMKGSDPSAGRIVLRQRAKAARSQGFVLVDGRASAALDKSVMAKRIPRSLRHLAHTPSSTQPASN
jgi:hypothetical protein